MNGGQDMGGMMGFGPVLAEKEKLMADRGLVGSDEIDAGKSLRPPKAVPRILNAGRVPAVLASGGPTETDRRGAAAFPHRLARSRTQYPPAIPDFRGRAGTVTHVHGAHVFPDSNATGRGENPQWLYTVRFAARELWGEAADMTGTVSVDAWESYLEPR